MKSRDIIHRSERRDERKVEHFFRVNNNKNEAFFSSVYLCVALIFTCSFDWFFFALTPLTFPSLLSLHIVLRPSLSPSPFSLSDSVPSYSGQLQFKITKWRSSPCHKIKWNEMAHEKSRRMLVCSCHCVCTYFSSVRVCVRACCVPALLYF